MGALTVLSVEVETLKEILSLMQELTQGERDKLLHCGEEIACSRVTERARLRDISMHGGI